MIVKMYRVEGMNCGGCVSAVKTALKELPGVIEAQVQLDAPEAIISMESTLPEEKLQEALSSAGGYRIWELAEDTGKKTSATRKTFQKTLGIFQHKKECCK